MQDMQNLWNVDQCSCRDLTPKHDRWKCLINQAVFVQRDNITNRYAYLLTGTETFSVYIQVPLAGSCLPGRQMLGAISQNANQYQNKCLELSLNAFLTVNSRRSCQVIILNRQRLPFLRLKIVIKNNALHYCWHQWRQVSIWNIVSRETKILTASQGDPTFLIWNNVAKNTDCKVSSFRVIFN